jgi:hypothetical protein
MATVTVREYPFKTFRLNDTVLFTDGLLTDVWLWAPLPPLSGDALEQAAALVASVQPPMPHVQVLPLLRLTLWLTQPDAPDPIRFCAEAFRMNARGQAALLMADDTLYPWDVHFVSCAWKALAPGHRARWEAIFEFHLLYT